MFDAAILEDSMIVDDRLRSSEAAAYLRVSASTLAKWRMNGTGPKWNRCGPRIVIYLKSDLDDWLAK
jgi:predicted DNA-binding transcriptional regulator AlpA